MLSALSGTLLRDMLKFLLKTMKIISMSKILTLNSSDSSPSGCGGWGGANIFFGTRNGLAGTGTIREKLLRSVCPLIFLL